VSYVLCAISITIANCSVHVSQLPFGDALFAYIQPLPLYFGRMCYLCGSLGVSGTDLGAPSSEETRLYVYYLFWLQSSTICV
jgi:hypothetical protein